MALNLPKVEDITELVTQVKKMMPNIKDLVTTFNKGVTVKDALDFGKTFPVVITSLSMAVDVLTQMVQEFNPQSITELNEFVRNLALRDAQGKFVLDEKGNIASIITPFVSITSGVIEMLKLVDWKTVLLMPLYMKELQIVFKDIFAAMDKIIKDNKGFLSKIKSEKVMNTVVEEIVKDKQKKKEKKWIEPGTGGVFKELAVIMSSMKDIAFTMIALGKRTISTRLASKLVGTTFEKLFETIKSVIKLMDGFSKKWEKKQKEYENSWSSFKTVVVSITTTMVILGWLAIPAALGSLLFYGFINLLDWLVLPSIKKICDELNKKKFKDGLYNALKIMSLIGTVFLTFAISLLIISLTVKENFKDIMLGLGAVILIMGIVIGIFWLIGKFLKPEDLTKPMLSLLILSGALLLLTGVLYILGEINTKHIGKALLGLGGLLLITIGMLILLKFVQFGVNDVLGGWAEIAKNLITVTAATLLLAGVLWIINWMFEGISIGQILIDMLILGGVVATVIFMEKAIQEANIDMGTIFSILALSVGVLAIAYAIKIVTESVDSGMALVAVGSFVVTAMMLVGMFIAVGTFCASGVGGVVIALAIAAFISIGAAALMLATAIKTIVEAIQIIVEVASNKEKVTEAMANIPTLITSFVDAILSVPLASLGKAVVKANLIAMAIGPASAALAQMIGVIKDMADGRFTFTRDGREVEYNIIEMFNNGMLDKIGDNLTTLITGFANAISSIDWQTCKRVAHRVDFMEELGECVGPVYDLIDMVKNFAEGTIEVNGETINLIDWVHGNQGMITYTIQQLILGFMDAMAMGMQLSEAEDWWDDVFEEYMDAAKDGLDEVPDVMEGLMAVLEGCQTICDAFNEGSLRSELPLLSTNVANMVLGISDWVGKVDFNNIEKAADISGKLVDISKDLSRVVENVSDAEFGDGFPEFIDNNTKFIESINKIDTSKANALAGVLDKLTKFSDTIDGNFDKLADAISDRLINALERLSGALEDANGGSEGLGAKISAMAGRVKSGIGGFIGDAVDFVAGGESDAEKKERKEYDEEQMQVFKDILEELSDINNTLIADGVKVQYKPNA